jgi:putative acetyltransferase
MLVAKGGIMTWGTLRKAILSDADKIYKLYQLVAQVNRGSLTQEADELTFNYVWEMVNNGCERGLILVGESEGQIIAYLKAFTSRFRCLAHVLGEATMMVHPDWQGSGWGRKLMSAYLDEIRVNLRHILRFELLPHQSNQKAIEFYQKFGFMLEGESVQRIRRIDGAFESELKLVWVNPNFSLNSLKDYCAFLNNLTRQELRWEPFLRQPQFTSKANLPTLA